LALAEPVGLETREEKRAVLVDRAAEGPAELVLPEDGLREIRLCGEIILRGQVVIAMKFESVSMKLVRARFGNHVYVRARAGTEFSGRDIGLNSELLDGIDGGCTP